MCWRCGEGLDHSFSPCSDCSRLIRKQAKICRFCGSSGEREFANLAGYVLESGPDPASHIHYLNLCLQSYNLEKISRHLNETATSELKVYWRNDFVEILADWELNELSKGLDQSAEVEKLVNLYHIDSDKYKELKHTKWKQLRVHIANETALRGWHWHKPLDWHYALSPATQYFEIDANYLADICASIDDLFSQMETKIEQEASIDELFLKLYSYGLTPHFVQAELDRRAKKRKLSFLSTTFMMNQPPTNARAIKEKIIQRIEGCNDTIRRGSKFLDRYDTSVIRAQQSLNEAQESGNISSIKRAQEHLARAKFHLMEVYGGINFMLAMAAKWREELERLEESESEKL